MIIRGATEHNLRNIDVEFPLGLFILVTGVSGSGKSTLINDILYRAAAKVVYGSRAEPGAHDLHQRPGTNRQGDRNRSGPYRPDAAVESGDLHAGFHADPRFFARLPESRERGYKPGRFSFNVKGGRCEACQGDGLKRIEMNFLPDVYVTCDVCRGRRYNHETLQVKYKGYSIADLLDMPVEDALKVLEHIPQIKAKLETLVRRRTGISAPGSIVDYAFGRRSPAHQAGQRTQQRQTGKTLYILDEPTTGLHFEDISKLLEVLQNLVDLGNTVVVIEHQLDVIKTADWIIDLGPEGGERGGAVVASRHAGTDPEEQ